MARRSRSQSALPQKNGWGSKNAADLQPDFVVGSNRPPSSLMARTAPDKRPPSSRRLPPVDKPGSHKMERPQSGIRPFSAARPLSGRVFMRHSSKRGGWVAKAYPDANTSHSQPDLLGSELDLLSSESLDSFFDEDYEEDKEENLGNLLSCNTLGVESKTSRRDWVAGGVDVPKFHCPRCRDHWYGYSSVPCDEELARLIREGLWYTGNKGKQAQASLKSGMFVPGEAQANGRDATTGVSDGTQKGKLPRLKSSYKKAGSSTGADWQYNRDDDAKKKKKRITFKLDDSASDGSSTDLNGDGHGGSRKGGASGLEYGGRGVSGLDKSARARGTGGSGEDRADAGDGTVVGGGSGSAGLVGHNGLEGNSSSGRHGGSGDQYNSSFGSSRDGNGGAGALNPHSSRGSHNGSNANDSTTRGLHNMNTNSNADSSLGRGDSSGRYGRSNGLPGQSEDLGNGYGELSDNGINRSSAAGSGNGAGTLNYGSNGLSNHGSSIVNKFGDGSDENRKGKRNSQTNGAGSSESGNSGDTSSQPVDHGKRIRKPGGYMRAVSPTSSEWGDHLHAHSFISSSIHSRSGSISSTSGVRGGDTSNSSNKDGGRESLPPIVPRIIGVDHDWLGWAPDFTRAWTFSYFNSN